MAKIKKEYGDGAVMRLGEAKHLAVEIIPTGSLALDRALGVGGIPRGRVSEIFGPEASGKTTVCQHIVAESQKLGGVAAFIDMEHALDPSYAARCGVDIDNLYISQPDTGEQALEITETLVRSGAIDVVIIDSVAALVPRSEIEGDMGDPTMGMQARLMSQALRKLSGAIKQTNTAVVFTNQLRMKIGVMFGNPETTSGGRALKFYASIRIDVRQTVVLPEASGPKISLTRPRGMPPIPSAKSNGSDPVGIDSTSKCLASPNRITAPSPKRLTISPNAIERTSSRSFFAPLLPMICSF